MSVRRIAVHPQCGYLIADVLTESDSLPPRTLFVVSEELLAPGDFKHLIRGALQEATRRGLTKIEGLEDED